MPVIHRSPNSIPPAQTYIAFLISVAVGARRFAQTSWLRGDRALHGLLGIDRFPSDDTIRNLFLRFGMGEVQRFFECKRPTNPGVSRVKRSSGRV